MKSKIAGRMKKWRSARMERGNNGEMKQWKLWIEGSEIGKGKHGI